MTQGVRIQVYSSSLPFLTNQMPWAPILRLRQLKHNQTTSVGSSDGPLLTCWITLQEEESGGSLSGGSWSLGLLPPSLAATGGPMHSGGGIGAHCALHRLVLQHFLTTTASSFLLKVVLQYFFITIRIDASISHSIKCSI